MSDWEALTHWLEANDRHVRAYNVVEDMDIKLDNFQSELADSLMISENAYSIGGANTDEADIDRDANIGKGYIALLSKNAIRVPLMTFSLLLLIAFFVPWSNTNHIADPDIASYVTAATQTKSIQIADGSNIDLNRNSRVEVELSDNARRVRLIEGEALFEVTKDVARPFFVMTDDTQVRVVGTKFNVLRHKDHITVTVAEGIVEVTLSSADNTGLKPYRMIAGQQLRYDPNISKVTVNEIDANNFLSWREGQLIYENTRLAEVINDLNRYFEKTITLSPDIENILFSGVLLTDDMEASLLVLESSLPLNISSSDNSITISRRSKE